jgi:hypothetical protein
MPRQRAEVCPHCPVRIDQSQLPFACVVLDRRECEVVRIRESLIRQSVICPPWARLGARHGVRRSMIPVVRLASALGLFLAGHGVAWLILQF